MNNNAQKFLNKRLGSMTDLPPTDVTDPGDGTPVVDTKPEPVVQPPNQPPEIPDISELKGGGNKISQNEFVNNGKHLGNNNQGNDYSVNLGTPNEDSEEGGNKISQNEFVNNGTMIGDNNQGNDYSVTIGFGTNGNVAGGGSGDYDNTSAMRDNFLSGAATAALNDNQFAKSQSQLKGSTRAAQDIERAEELTGTMDRVRELRYTANLTPQYWGARADMQTNLALGDIYSMKAPDFVMPEPYKRPKSNVEELADKYYND